MSITNKLRLPQFTAPKPTPVIPSAWLVYCFFKVTRVFDSAMVLTHVSSRVTYHMGSKRSTHSAILPGHLAVEDTYYYMFIANMLI